MTIVIEDNKVIEFIGPCDFCTAPVHFVRVEYGYYSHGLKAMFEGAGSDYLAIWCEDCGPRHRNN